MLLGLENKIALVSGASQGIGFATALAFSKEGSKVAICSSNIERISKAAEKIKNITGGDVIYGAVDLNNAIQINNFVNLIIKTWGTIHICVTNAGGPPMTNFMSTTDEVWNDAINLTLMSAIRLSRSVIPTMQKQRWGRIIHISSLSVKNTIPNLLLSNSIRPAVTAMAKVQADEFGSDGILVNSILPGSTDTERGRKFLESKALQMNLTTLQALEARKNSIPLGRIANPGEIANGVLFLASECASFITGTVLTMDGGETRFAF